MFQGRKVFCCWSWPLMAMIIAKKLLCQCSICRAEASQRTTTNNNNQPQNHTFTSPVCTPWSHVFFCCWSWPLMALIWSQQNKCCVSSCQCSICRAEATQRTKNNDKQQSTAETHIHIPCIYSMVAFFFAADHDHECSRSQQKHCCVMEMFAASKPHREHQ